MPDRLRERLTILQGVVALSQGPPLPRNERGIRRHSRAIRKAMTAYRTILATHALALDPKPEVCFP